MKILLTCLNFKGLTGSELYFLDLACGLQKIGNDVSILSQMKDGFLHEKASKYGVKCYDFSQAPNEKFDIILASHRPVIKSFVEDNLYADTPIISINHSEVIQLEFPLIDLRIVHYIAIRESIKSFLKDKYFIDDEMISLIHNPINTDKLLSKKGLKPKRKYVLFPATIDYLRKETIIDLSKKANEENFDLVIVGENKSDYIESVLSENVTWHTPSWEIQNFYRNATHTSGIQMGRTEIEGYFFGLPCYRYNVNRDGEIISNSLIEPPDFDTCMETYGYISVAKKIENLINKILTK